MNRKWSASIAVLAGFVLLSVHSCKKTEEPNGIDKQLFDMAVPTTGFVWYKNSSAFLNRSSGSGHSQQFLRVRYNGAAAAHLDSAGKIVAGSIFSDGSLVVKELYENQTTLDRYAILYKKASDPNADANGWVWGYINADQSVAAPASDKGSACRSCHSQADNIDYMLMNKYFP